MHRAGGGFRTEQITRPDLYACCAKRHSGRDAPEGGSFTELAIRSQQPTMARNDRRSGALTSAGKARARSTSPTVHACSMPVLLVVFPVPERPLHRSIGGGPKARLTTAKVLMKNTWARQGRTAPTHRARQDAYRGRSSSQRAPPGSASLRGTKICPHTYKTRKGTCAGCTVTLKTDTPRAPLRALSRPFPDRPSTCWNHPGRLELAAEPSGQRSTRRSRRIERRVGAAAVGGRPFRPCTPGGPGEPWWTDRVQAAP